MYEPARSNDASALMVSISTELFDKTYTWYD